MTAQELIKAALRAVGAIPTGETPTASELADGLEALQIMLRSWAAEGLLIYAYTEDTHTLTAGDGEYSIGSGGDIDTTRPERIESAYIKSGNVDY